MDSRPLISVLTPVWNGMPYIKECVESVLKQDYQNWELIISDNGSTDDTRNYLDSLSDTRIVVYKQDRNLGIMGNVNFLFSKAKAPVSQILCADDYFVSERSLSVIAGYWRNASPGIGFARFGHDWTSKLMIRNQQPVLIPRVVTPDQSDLMFFIFDNFPGNLSDVSVRTHLVADTGNFNEAIPFAGDLDFWSRLGRRVSMGVEKELLIYVRRHDKVASNYLSLKGELLDQHLEIYQHLIERLSDSVDRKKLLDFFHYHLFAFHYRNAIKAATGGQFGYMKKVISVNSPVLWSKWKRLIFTLPFALFNPGQKITYYMARSIMKDFQARNGIATVVPA